MFAKISPKVAWLSAAVVALLLLGAGTVAYALHYADRALPGTTVAGQAVRGMTRAQVADMVTARAADTSVIVHVDGTATKTSLDHAGVTVDAEGTADAAFARNASVLSRIGALFSWKNFPAATVVDDAKMKALSQEIATALGNPVVDATVVVAEGGESYTTTPAKSGTGVAFDQLRDTVMTAATTLTAGESTLNSSTLMPTVDDARAAAVAKAANDMAAFDVKLSDGEGALTPSQADKISWVKVAVTENGTLADPVLNEDKVKEWVASSAASTNREVVNGRHNVNTRGEIVQTPKKGVAGRTAKDVDQLASSVVAALAQGKQFSGDFSYDVVEPTYERKTIADGAENLVYQAAPGEKWLEINLGNNSVTAYEGATVVHGPVLIVPGSPGHETVTGLFHIYLKYRAQDMGCTPDWPYCAKGVPWVSYFHGSYAFHGAPWQDTFGWNGPGGSHGCINMPVSEAHWVYEWGEVGTPVMSHY